MRTELAVQGLSGDRKPRLVGVISRDSRNELITRQVAVLGSLYGFVFAKISCLSTA